MLHETEATYMNGHSYKTNGKTPQPITTDAGQKADEEHQAYAIEEQDSPPSVPPLRSLLGNITLFTTWTCCVFYVEARFRQCRQMSSLDKLTSLRVWLLFCLELILLSPECLQAIELLLSLAPSKAPWNRPSRRLVGLEAPLVHILITYVLADCTTVIQNPLTKLQNLRRGY